MQPPEPQFVRLSPHHEQLRESHATAFTRVDTVIQRHVFKQSKGVADPSVGSPPPSFPSLLGFPSYQADSAAAEALS